MLLHLYWVISTIPLGLLCAAISHTADSVAVTSLLNFILLSFILPRYFTAEVTPSIGTSNKSENIAFSTGVEILESLSPVVFR
jgi:hypothetical protein